MTVTVTPTVDLVNSPPRVKLSVASTGETSTTITRLNPDGTTVPVRTNDGKPLPISAGAALAYDYEMPYQAVTYSSLESPATVSASVTVGATGSWLVHPTVPARSMQVTFRPGTLQDETLTVKQSVLYPLGRVNPLVTTDGTRKGSQSQLVIVVSDLGQLAAIKALLADAGVLLLNSPPSLGIGYDYAYIAVGDVKISRLTDIVIDGYRDVTLPFVVVDRPAGGSAAQRALVDLTRFASIAAVNAAYSTLAAAQAGP